jgi:hypothetical protein
MLSDEESGDDAIDNNISLSEKAEEFAKHIGIDLDDPSDRIHAWIAQRAVDEPLPEGWTQHEDEDGFLYFYDGIMDVSSWEHPRESFWKRTLDESRRAESRKLELAALKVSSVTINNGRMRTDNISNRRMQLTL